MKAKLFILSLFLILSLKVTCQWNLNSTILSTNIPYDCNTGTRAQLRGSFISPSMGIYGYFIPPCSPTSNSVSGIFLSKDSCQSWNPVSSVTSGFDFYYDTLFRSDIYITSYYQRSVDGGLNWSGFSTYPGQFNVPTRISAYNGRYGYGYGNGVFYRLDHDTCYPILNHNGSMNWYLFEFLSDSLGFGSSGDTLFRTGNGGLSWDTVLIGSSSTFYDLIWVNDSVGIIPSIGNSFYKTTDHGLTWQIFHSNINYFPGSVFSYGTDTIYGFNYPDNIYHDSTLYSELMKSVDCGLHWDSIPFKQGYIISSFRMFSATLGYIFAYRIYYGDYYFFQTRTGLLDVVNEPPVYVNNIFPNPFIDRINITSSELNYDIQIIDCLGKIVYSKKSDGELENVIYPHLSSGLYFLQFTTANVSKTFKLIRVEN